MKSLSRLCQGFVYDAHRRGHTSGNRRQTRQCRRPWEPWSVLYLFSFPMIGRTDGRSPEEDSNICLSRRLEQCGRRRQAWGNWRALERASKKKQLASRALLLYCYVRDVSVAVWDFARVRRCCDEEEDTKGGSWRMWSTLRGVFVFPFPQRLSDGGLPGLIYPARDLDFKTWEEKKFG
jgi:hypothetical protein